MGKVVHFEVPAEDTDRAGKFYKEIFGWDIMAVPEMDYIMASSGPTEQGKGPTAPGYINGGITKRGNGLSAPVIVMDVEDIDAAMAKIKEHGGEEVRPKVAVGTMGLIAYFKDSEGNVMGVWQTTENK